MTNGKWYMENEVDIVMDLQSRIVDIGECGKGGPKKEPAEMIIRLLARNAALKRFPSCPGADLR